MPSYTQRGASSTVMKQRRAQFQGKFLDLPAKSFLAHYKKLKLQSLVKKLSKEEMMDSIRKSARLQAARDRHKQIRKRVKTKPWLETLYRPRGPQAHFAAQSNIPQIVVTTPDGETRWVEDPNNYECVHKKENRVSREPEANTISELSNRGLPGGITSFFTTSTFSAGRNRKRAGIPKRT